VSQSTKLSRRIAQPEFAKSRTQIPAILIAALQNQNVYEEVFAKALHVTQSETAHSLQFARHLNVKTSRASRIPRDSHNASTRSNLVQPLQNVKSHHLALKTASPTNATSHLTAMLPPTRATKLLVTLPAPHHVVST